MHDKIIEKCREYVESELRKVIARSDISEEKQRTFYQPMVDKALRDFEQLYKFCKEKELVEYGYEKPFHHLFWELYLAKWLWSMGVEVQRKRLPKSSNMPPCPDFYFVKDGRTIWIEAVTCNEPDKKSALNRIKEPDELGFGQNVDNEIMLRMTQAITAKDNEKDKDTGKPKYPEFKYKETINDAPLIIAVNDYQISRNHHEIFGLAIPRICKVAYGIGAEYLRISRTGECEHGFEEKMNLSRESLTKVANEQQITQPSAGVGIGFFRKPEFHYIAGIIYSRISLMDFGPNDFYFLPNPYASLRVDRYFDFCNVRANFDGSVLELNKEKD